MNRCTKLTNELKMSKVLPKSYSEVNDKIHKLNCDNDVENVPLDLESIQRFSRQLILPEVGPTGQKNLQNSSILIVGCGGLGCPAAIYLAAAGVGTLGLVDYDEVELSNLHRQILHTESTIGVPKAESVKNSVRDIYKKINCISYCTSLSSNNIMSIVSNYDIVLDCTDNVPTRYLLNDACYFAKKPLVSGAALRFEGQLTIYGFNDGPCYRCLFPDPPPPDTVTNCSDGGVLGVVPGIIGCLQALETIKLIIGRGDLCYKRMILFDALSSSFRNVKLRRRQDKCQLCGTLPTILTLIDYEQFCGSKATDKDQSLELLQENKRIYVTDLKDMMDQNKSFILVDVRSPVELEICRFPDSINIFISEIEEEKARREISQALETSKSNKIICLCTRGNDSQRAVLELRQHFPNHFICDVIGGMTSWTEKFGQELLHPFNCDDEAENLCIDLEGIQRYSRQLILPEIRPTGQKKLRNSSVLIVGCGGLGCPAAIYLAAAGVGTLGLVDYDEVELSNLHRQILHTESKIGMPKAESIKDSIQRLNKAINCIPYYISLSGNNIMDIVSKYDIVLDCTDNVATRYLLNDACFFAKKPLISGSALRFEGQLAIYGFDDGPCYRCLFPVPPPPDTVTNCSDGGVLGVVPGIIGCLQALEAIKLITENRDECHKRMFLFNALFLSFRNIKLRGRQDKCHLCGTSPTISTLIDYEQFCGGKATDKDQGLKLLEESKRISVTKLKKMIDEKTTFLLVDIRPPVELEICSLPGSINVPIQDIEGEIARKQIKQALETLNTNKIICLCRRGNDSQRAVVSLEQHFPDIFICDVIGGLTSWAKNIDKEFPLY